MAAEPVYTTKLDRDLQKVGSRELELGEFHLSTQKHGNILDVYMYGNRRQVKVSTKDGLLNTLTAYVTEYGTDNTVHVPLPLSAGQDLKTLANCMAGILLKANQQNAPVHSAAEPPSRKIDPRDIGPAMYNVARLIVLSLKDVHSRTGAVGNTKFVVAPAGDRAHDKAWLAQLNGDHKNLYAGNVKLLLGGEGSLLLRATPRSDVLDVVYDSHSEHVGTYEVKCTGKEKITELLKHIFTITGLAARTHKNTVVPAKVAEEFIHDFVIGFMESALQEVGDRSNPKYNQDENTPLLSDTYSFTDFDVESKHFLETIGRRVINGIWPLIPANLVQNKKIASMLMGDNIGAYACTSNTGAGVSLDDYFKPDDDELKELCEKFQSIVDAATAGISYVDAEKQNGKIHLAMQAMRVHGAAEPNSTLGVDLERMGKRTFHVAGYRLSRNRVGTGFLVFLSKEASDDYADADIDTASGKVYLNAKAKKTNGGYLCKSEKLDAGSVPSLKHLVRKMKDVLDKCRAQVATAAAEPSTPSIVFDPSVHAAETLRKIRPGQGASLTVSGKHVQVQVVKSNPEYSTVDMHVRGIPGLTWLRLAAANKHSSFISIRYNRNPADTHGFYGGSAGAVDVRKVDSAVSFLMKVLGLAYKAIHLKHEAPQRYVDGVVNGYIGTALELTVDDTREDYNANTGEGTDLSEFFSADDVDADGHKKVQDIVHRFLVAAWPAIENNMQADRVNLDAEHVGHSLLLSSGGWASDFQETRYRDGVDDDLGDFLDACAQYLGELTPYRVNDRVFSFQ